MNKFVTDYIDIVLKQIKYKNVHNAIAAEIEDHISELTTEYISNGLEEDQAIQKAISQMGDPEEIGKNLHRTHKPKFEWSIIALTGIIVIFGLYMILSYSVTYLNTEYFYKQLGFAVIGTIILLICNFINYSKLEKYSLHLYCTVTLFMFLSVILGGKIQGEKYLFILGHSINPSVISIPFLLIFYAGITKKFCDGKVISMLKLLGLSSLPLIVCLMQPSLANAMIIGTGFLIILTYAICDKNFNGNSKKFLISIYTSITTLFALLVLYTISTSPYRWQRLLILLNPELDPTGAGYLNTVLDRLLSSSKFFGSNNNLVTMNSSIGYKLPGGDSEFIFTYIVSSFGWLFGIILILLLSLLIICIFNAANKISDRYGKYLSIGIGCVFSLQVITNILMNLGFFPISCIALPFISYGGTSFVCNMSLIGLLLGVYRRKDIVLKQSVSAL